MAKINPLYVLVIILVIAFLLLIFTSSSSYLPYENEKANYAAYEPMSPMESKPSLNTTIDIVEPNVKSNTSSSGSSIFGMQVPYLGTGTENFEPIVDVPQTVQYAPFRDSEIIDKFSQVKTNGIDGVDGCVSSGLSNSGGYICLTPELIQLLKTRGGNASGVNGNLVSNAY